LQEPQSMINQRVNYILRGLCEWWKYADDREKAVWKIHYILRYATAKLYAAKFRCNSIAAIFKKAGKDLSKPLSSRKSSVVGLLRTTDDKIEHGLKATSRRLVAFKTEAGKRCDRGNAT
jgi:hypothetical protein